MRGLLWLIILLGGAVAVAFGARPAGYVLIVYPPYRIELTLALFAVALAIAFFALYVVLRIAAQTLRLPREIRALTLRRRRNKARGALRQGVTAFFEGNYARAEKAAAAALKSHEAPALSAVVAARSAHEMHNFDARDQYLKVAEAAVPEAKLLRLVTQAELLLDQGLNQQVLQILKAARELGPKNVRVLRLEVKARAQAKDWEQTLAALAQLQKQNGIGAQEAEQIRIHAYEEILSGWMENGKSLVDYWQKIPASGKSDKRLARAVAQRLIALGMPERAQEIIERSLEKEWDSALVACYGDCAGPNVLEQIERAEKWLAMHPDDAPLLAALGKLCMREGLWGKARSYLEASLAVAPTRAAQDTLFELSRRMRGAQETLSLSSAAIG
jgi:HemY protein